MGIEVQTVKLLLLARRLGVDFTSTLTIGRQDVLATPDQAASVFARFGEKITDHEARTMSGKDDPFSDALFRKLGARSVDAMDISDFEGATLIHDLNRPLPPDQSRRFSLVFDGGTLEHVFANTTALATYMSLVEVGGHLIVAVPANNEMGHGFVQFSPEYFFRTLTAANGYRIEGLFLAPMFVDADWLLARDPASVGARVGHNGATRSTYIFVVAQRFAAEPIFATSPQQSDYAADWARLADRAGQGHGGKPGLKARVASKLPRKLVDALVGIRKITARPDPRHLAPFTPERAEPSLAGRQPE
ncbi:hypothetical protein [uncultured Sphingomonas sp.]|uniref:hypothetical protein n=1 Tax=uncultured Sphingomonas sp. TaxID=158754 RepID=UPI0035CB79CB